MNHSTTIAANCLLYTSIPGWDFDGVRSAARQAWNDYLSKIDIRTQNADQRLNLIYTEKVREDEGGTYGVYPMGQLVKYPTERAVLQIFFNTAPDKQDKLMKIISVSYTHLAKRHLPPRWQQNSIRKSSVPTPGKYTGAWISVQEKTWPTTL